MRVACLVIGRCLGDAVVEVGGEQDGDHGGDVGADQLAALGVAGAAVVTDLQSSKWRTIRLRSTAVKAVVPTEAGTVSMMRARPGQYPCVLLEQDEGAEPVGDEVLDVGDLVASGLIADLSRSATCLPVSSPMYRSW